MQLRSWFAGSKSTKLTYEGQLWRVLITPQLESVLGPTGQGANYAAENGETGQFISGTPTAHDRAVLALAKLK